MTRPSCGWSPSTAARSSAPASSAAIPTCRADPDVLLRWASGWSPTARAAGNREQRAARTPYEETRRRGRAELEGLSSDADPAGQAFLKRRGFAERDRSRYVALDVQTATVEPAVPPPASPSPASPSTPASSGGYAVACEAIPDVPEEEPMTAGTYEDWRAFWIDPPSVRPETVFLATVDGHVAGYSTLALPGARPGVGVHTMTGVARAHRGQGIAAALKRHAIAWAAANGVRTLESENVEANAAIRTLNDQLGYRPLADHVWLHGHVTEKVPQTEAP